MTLPAGLKFTCANGHPYAQVREPIAVGELDWVVKLDWLSDLRPVGLVEPRCSCGAPLMAPAGGFYTDDGVKP